jgi:hypothetical protein
MNNQHDRDSDHGDLDERGEKLPYSFIFLFVVGSVRLSIFSALPISPFG